MAEDLDLLDLGDEGLYFDEPCSPEVEALIAQASRDYGQAAAEPTVEVDERDVLGAAPLLAVIAQRQAQDEDDLEPASAR